MRATYNCVATTRRNCVEVRIPELSPKVIATYQNRDTMLTHIEQDLQRYLHEWFVAAENRGKRYPEPATEVVPVTLTLPYTR